MVVCRPMASVCSYRIAYLTSNAGVKHVHLVEFKIQKKHTDLPLKALNQCSNPVHYLIQEVGINPQWEVEPYS